MSPRLGSAISATELSFKVLYVFGPGGVGKTTLLDEFVHLCDETESVEALRRLDVLERSYA